MHIFIYICAYRVYVLVIGKITEVSKETQKNLKLPSKEM